MNELEDAHTKNRFPFDPYCIPDDFAVRKIPKR
jgi:hypothetical protein